jgi:hypothetical protein
VQATKGEIDKVDEAAREVGGMTSPRAAATSQLVVSKRAAISPRTGERVRYVPLAQLRPAFAGARRVLS